MTCNHTSLAVRLSIPRDPDTRPGVGPIGPVFSGDGFLRRLAIGTEQPPVHVDALPDLAVVVDAAGKPTDAGSVSVCVGHDQVGVVRMGRLATRLELGAGHVLWCPGRAVRCGLDGVCLEMQSDLRISVYAGMRNGWGHECNGDRQRQSASGPEKNARGPPSRGRRDLQGGVPALYHAPTSIRLHIATRRR